MWLKRQIPNSITLLNLLAGCIAVICAVHNKLEWTALFVIIGIGFDFFDGFAARILNVQSDLGLQLDSLADMVTSGLAPGLVMYQLLSIAEPSYIINITPDFQLSSIGVLGLLVTLASAYRLAKFNIDTRQTTSFIGLPTPANTLLIISLPLILKYQSAHWIDTILLNKWVLIFMTLLSCYLLNAEIRLFALKFKTWNFVDNRVRYIFLVLSIVLIVLLKYAAIPCVILLYVLMSVFFKEKTNQK